jgi:hypothetical protein
VDNLGYRLGSAVRGALALTLGTILLLAAYFALVVYPRTATDRLENDSMGNSVFYVDGNNACNAASGTFCTVKLHVFRSHRLAAWTTYSSAETYTTPPVTLQAKDGEVYRFLSCGQTGTLGQTCGLFGVSVVPQEY